MAHAQRAFIPAAGRDWLLPLYDPLQHFLGGESLHRELLEQAAPPPGARVLDVGCGGGRHIRQTRLLPGIDAVAIDVGDKEVRDTQRMLKELDQHPIGWGGTVPGAGRWRAVRWATG